ncbi:MAG: hypothetical protein MJ184_09480 [Treponema sp.]|uniref:sulfatase-like hydrolase/transferase n=1 Tax=Treponema sp. TaxID=166 RepID=UPI00298E015A|nr:sulfatase-like hydrolase/transferase [Treponema sp.]MCQ2601576.1 hypothetical protein [Treponema sp.]
MKKPLLVFYLCVCFGVVSIDWYLLMVHGGFFYKRIALVVILSSVFFIPLLIKFVRFLLNTELCSFVNNTRKSFALFFSSCLVLVLLCGLFIISNSVAASPMEFSFVGSVDSPWTYIIELFQKSLGLCLVWPLCIFLLFGKKIRALFSILFSTIAFCALVNAFLFDGGYGNFSSTFIFDNAAAVNSGLTSGLVNMFVLILVIVLVFILVRVKKTKWLVFVLSCVCLGLLGISLSLFPKISSGYQTYCELRKSDEYAGGKTNPVFQLSKTEKNIFIIDLDRAVNALLPAIFEERSDLKEKFSGFVYYPNTFSFSMNTLAASPAMFGGYDYIPQKIMERSDESLVNKHNEALKAIPVLFDSHGYNVTVSDLSFANYQWIADLSIFDDYSGIKAVTTERVYSDLWLEEHPEIMGKDSVSNLIRINSLWYTLLRVSPVFLRSLIYNSGRYWSTQKAENTFSNLIEQYSVLDYLPELTGFESVGPTYTFMVNDTTHEPAFLEAPDYIPVKTVTDFGSGPYSNDATFHVNIAALLRIGEWIDYLKSEGVYDNTRIIIVSDHGTNITTDQRVVQNDSFEPRVETFNPLLLVKDFGNQFPIQTDVSYMTNADVAALSCSGVIENPVNPFTQNPIDFSGKGNGIYGLVLEKFSPDNQNKNTFKDPQWYKTGNDVFSADAVKGVSAEEAMEAAK